MTTKEELNLILILIQKHGLPLSPILEYSINEKLRECPEAFSTINESDNNQIDAYVNLYKVAFEEASHSVKIVERLISERKQLEKLSLSQAIKELKAKYWKPEVIKIFKEAGVNDNFTPVDFIHIIPNNIKNGKIGIWKDKRIKDASGHYARNEKGVIKTKKEWEECKYFSVHILFLLLMQNGIVIK